MTKLNRLIREAREGCKWREHRMRYFQHNPSQTHAWSGCLDCKMGVFVNTRSMPNEKDICGGAVAVNCTGER